MKSCNFLHMLRPTEFVRVRTVGSSAYIACKNAAREGVPKNRVTLFVADDLELESYRRALQECFVSVLCRVVHYSAGCVPGECAQGSDWADVRITVSVPGIRDSRNLAGELLKLMWQRADKRLLHRGNFIYKYFPANTYVVSLDDDIEGIESPGAISCNHA